MFIFKPEKSLAAFRFITGFAAATLFALLLAAAAPLSTIKDLHMIVISLNVIMLLIGIIGMKIARRDRQLSRLSPHT